MLEVEYLDNGARIIMLNVGNSEEQLTDFAIGDDERTKPLGEKKIPIQPGNTVEIAFELSPERLKSGKPFEIRMWSESGREFYLKMPSKNFKTRR